MTPHSHTPAPTPGITPGITPGMSPGTPPPREHPAPPTRITAFDAASFIDDTTRHGHPGTNDWKVPVRLPPAPGEMEGAAIEWWNPRHHRGDRIAAFQCIQQSEAPIEAALQRLGFYKARPVVQAAIRRIRQRCDDPYIHFAQQLDRLQEHIQTTGQSLEQIVLRKDFAYFERFAPAQLPASA